MILKASDYPKFRPIPRLHRDVVITEKVDGTNGLIEVLEVPDYNDLRDLPDVPGRLVYAEDKTYILRAGSRNRWLTPAADNFGFARWVWDNANELVALGEGKHYGEWFGRGIQRGYGLDEKRFALFRTDRWFDPRNPDVNDEFKRFFPKAVAAPEVVTVVPVMLVAAGESLNYAVDMALHTLRVAGSLIADGFMNPEGIVVWHQAAEQYFKVMLENDESPKSKVQASK